MMGSQKEMWRLPLGSCYRVGCETKGRILRLRPPSFLGKEAGIKGGRDGRKEDGSEEEKFV